MPLDRCCINNTGYLEMYLSKSVVLKNIFRDNYVKITGYLWIFDFNTFAKLASSPIIADHLVTIIYNIIPE